MNSDNCKAITRSGKQCACRARITSEGVEEYCYKHDFLLKRMGPIIFEYRQLRNEYASNKKKITEEVGSHPYKAKLWEARANYMKQVVEMDKRYAEFRSDYADAMVMAREYNEVYLQKRKLRKDRKIQRRLERLERRLVAAAAQEPRTLAVFAADPQNIHTTEAVQHTKKMIEVIRKIHVPEAYQWNMSKVSKTLTEIIEACNLTPDAVWQMTSKYCSDETIYDLENGIYGKVLDSVWQYIIKSEHIDDLIKILKTELTDNVGMCAQGNLSRLCNVLTGYLDGLNPQIDRHAQFCDRMAKLAEMDDPIERYRLAFRLFDEYGTSKEDTAHWLDALHDMDSVD